MMRGLEGEDCHQSDFVENLGQAEWTVRRALADWFRWSHLLIFRLLSVGHIMPTLSREFT